MLDPAGWRMSTIANQPGRDDPGRFDVVDGVFEAVPGTDLGLLWHTTPAPPDFVLALEWRCTREDDNSGVHVRFPRPDGMGYGNTAYVAVDFGFEVQIDHLARHDGAGVHKTGAIYGLAAPADPDHLPVRPVGTWNEFEIHVVDQTYDVSLNGVPITHFVNHDPRRGTATPSFIGIQAHTGRVGFRNIRLSPA